LVAVDRDPIIINIAKEVLKDYEGRVEFISESYQNLDVILKNRKLDAILLDI
jgi:16S rRNA C1402 N4-methylase RsmH